LLRLVERREAKVARELRSSKQSLKELRRDAKRQQRAVKALKDDLELVSEARKAVSHQL